MVNGVDIFSDPTCCVQPGRATSLSSVKITLDHRLPIPDPYPTSFLRKAKLLLIQRSMSQKMLLHNHPSGDPKPSRDDIEMTRRLKEAASAFEIALHDHIVIGHGTHASFRSLGLL